MEEAILLKLLKFDLNRTGAMLDDEYLTTLIKAAQLKLKSEGITLADTEDCQILVIGYAAWIYRKRITGDKMPQYVRCLRNDMLVSQKMAGAANA